MGKTVPQARGEYEQGSWMDWVAEGVCNILATAGITKEWNSFHRTVYATPKL